MKINFKLLSFLIIFISICFIGCEKEELPRNTNFSDNPNLARLWLEDEHSQMAKNVLWEHAKSIEFENKWMTMISVPVRKENNKIFEIVVFTIYNTNIDGVIWTMISENEGYDNTYYDLGTHQILENFSGILKVSKLSGQIESEIEYVDGSMKGIIKGKLAHMPSECDACHKAITLDEVVVTADGDGGDWWFDDPCSTYYDPCKCGGFGCGGGVVGGGSGNSTSINNWEEKIDDSQLKPCMQKIMSDLKKLNKGVGQIIQKFAGGTPGYNWEVKDGVLKGGQNAITSQLYNRTTGTVTTTFDGSKFKSSTDLSIARTIFHESVHAYLVAYFKVDPLGASKSYSGLVSDWAKGIYGDQNTNQHAEFVRSFVDEIAIALEEYGISKGYSHSPQFYNDLAWGGLTHTGAVDASGNPIETTWFQTAVPTSTDRKRIVNNITIELTGKDFTGTTKTQQGTDAGC